MGAKNSTSDSPTTEISPKSKALGSMCSLKIIAPAGTSTTGLRVVMNSALATVVLVIAEKNRVMLSPNAMPGMMARRNSLAVTQRRSATNRMIVQTSDDPTIRQNAIVGPGAPDLRTSELLMLKHATAVMTANTPSGRTRPGAGAAAPVGIAAVMRRRSCGGGHAAAVMRWCAGAGWRARSARWWRGRLAMIACGCPRAPAKVGIDSR